MLMKFTPVRPMINKHLAVVDPILFFDAVVDH